MAQSNFTEVEKSAINAAYGYKFDTGQRRRSSDSDLRDNVTVLEHKDLVEIDGLVFNFVRNKINRVVNLADLYIGYKQWLGKSHPDVTPVSYGKFVKTLRLLS